MKTAKEFKTKLKPIVIINKENKEEEDYLEVKNQEAVEKVLEFVEVATKANCGSIFVFMDEILEYYNFKSQLFLLKGC